MSTTLQNTLEVLRTLKFSSGGGGHYAIHTKDSRVTLLVTDTSISLFHTAAAKSLSLIPQNWNDFLCYTWSVTCKMSPSLLHWPSFSSSGSQWSTGAQHLVFLPCMTFRGKCQPALKLSVDFSSKFKTLINLLLLLWQWSTCSMYFHFGR